MSQMKGAIFSLMIFVAVVVPAVLYITITNVYVNAFLKTTTEVDQVVLQEGGNTATVQNITNGLKDKGYTITLSDENNQPLDAGEKVEPGDEIKVHYELKYNGVYSEQTLQSEDSVHVLRR
ncbi:hypothetical protein [Heyndrickxia ginsengihumi]|uniref:hypothetical protein n=1 Tax=Heyndrickxia ginsengihumi TaxID=363870 RepID=UPI00046EBE7B|nr:hypothetical protein [Heyndrickxia ginsengihumi]